MNFGIGKILKRERIKLKPSTLELSFRAVAVHGPSNFEASVVFLAGASASLSRSDQGFLVRCTHVRGAFNDVHLFTEVY